MGTLRNSVSQSQGHRSNSHTWMVPLLAAGPCGDSATPAVTCLCLDVVHSFPFFSGSEHLGTHNCNGEKRRPSET